MKEVQGREGSVERLAGRVLSKDSVFSFYIYYRGVAGVKFVSPRSESSKRRLAVNCDCGEGEAKESLP